MAINRANGSLTGVRNKTSGGGNTITTIKNSGVFNVQTGTNEVDVLVIAGGGGGGVDNGGGGGAGGLRSFTNQRVQPGAGIQVTIGAGGAAGDASPSTSAGAGTDTVFANPLSPITSDGGGFGGSNNIAPGPGNAGSGGSGGGVGGGTTATAGSGNTPPTSPSQGNAGGAAGNDAGPAFSKCGGGGGGAGGAGTAGNNAAGFGGIGSPSTITGTDTLYAGGGGGGNENSNNNSAGGGIGGGGNGAVPNATAGIAGTTSTGSGGGGGQGSGDGGAGGSGVVIVKEKDKAGGMFNMNSQYNSVKSGQWPTVNIYDVTNSCRFNNGDSPKLSKALTAPNQRTFTISMWVKLGDFSGNMGLWTLGKALTGETGDYTTIDVKIGSGGRLAVDAYDGVADATRAAYNTAAGAGLLMRDPTAWYHFVFAFDTTDATAANRFKFYVNGDLQSGYNTTTSPAQDVDLFHPTSSSIEIGYDRGHNSYHDGYIAEFNYVDGQQLDCGHFGEPDPDNPKMWRPKNYEGSHGDNGVKLEFKQTGTSANASGIGADTSGNDNHQTVANLTSGDIVEDVPSNNFCTVNPLGGATSSAKWTFSEGNTQIQQNDNGNWRATGSTMAVANGKWYWEIEFDAGDMNEIFVGVHDTNVSLEGTNRWATGSTLFYNHNGGEVRQDGTNTSADYGELDVGDILGVALNMDDNQISFFDNGSAIVSDFSLSSSITGFAMPTFMSDDSDIVYKVNFGNSSFAVSSGNADANGYGNFEFAPPTGYFALCTKNIAQYG